MKRVLITAGASGIGFAMGEAFSAAGHEVWVTDVDDAALARCPSNWIARQVDVSSGVEAAPGQKDAALIARFSAAAQSVAV